MKKNMLLISLLTVLMLSITACIDGSENEVTESSALSYVEGKGSSLKLQMEQTVDTSQDFELKKGERLTLDGSKASGTISLQVTSEEGDIVYETADVLKEDTADTVAAAADGTYTVSVQALDARGCLTITIE